MTKTTASYDPKADAIAVRARPAPFGWMYNAERKLVPVPAQQRVLRQIRKLAGEGLSPRGISAELAARGVQLSHMGVRKILRRPE
jgi:hypothetical protein